MKKTFNTKTLYISIALLMLSFAAQAQSLTLETSQLQAQIQNIARPIFQIISAILAGASIFMLGKTLLDANRGDTNAWQKVGTVFVVALVWYFVIPSIIAWLFLQAGMTVNVRAN